jgi:hypothetical protein
VELELNLITLVTREAPIAGPEFFAVVLKVAKGSSDKITNLILRKKVLTILLLRCLALLTSFLLTSLLLSQEVMAKKANTAIIFRKLTAKVLQVAHLTSILA